MKNQNPKRHYNINNNTNYMKAERNTFGHVLFAMGRIQWLNLFSVRICAGGGEIPRSQFPEMPRHNFGACQPCH